MKNKSVEHSQKFIAILLALILSVLNAVPAFAEARDNYPTDIKSEIIKALNLISPTKDSFGLSNVDFNNLSLGQAINSYEFSDNKFLKLDYILYPIINDNKVVAYAIKNKGKTSIDITTTLVNEYNSNFQINDDISLIYDQNTCYAYTSKGFKPIFKNKESNHPGRDVLNYSKVDKSALSSVQLNTTYIVQPLNYTSQNISPWMILNVPMIKQSTANICWAAAMASIGNYMCLRNETDLTVAKNAFPSNWDRGLGIDEAVFALFRTYGIQFNYYYNAPSDSVIINSIAANRPLYGHWDAGFRASHATVINGINAIAGYLQVMEPSYGTFVTASLSQGYYTYTDVNYGVTCKLVYYAN